MRNIMKSIGSGLGKVIRMVIRAPKKAAKVTTSGTKKVFNVVKKPLQSDAAKQLLLGLAGFAWGFCLTYSFLMALMFLLFGVWTYGLIYLAVTGLIAYVGLMIYQMIEDHQNQPHYTRYRVVHP